ncbi:MAG: phosphatidylinositol-specific phospholipase C/glycerophosphodiester phosphodiesterase family protein [Sphingobium sp.]
MTALTAPHLIAHRRNRIEELQATPTHLGIEIDLRSRGGDIILHHDPFADGEMFADWLDHFRHGTLILNVKEEGLEDALIAMMADRGIENWFFLDQSFPFLVRTSRRGEHRCAVRVSEFETIDTALALAGKIDWVWVDCFTRFPLIHDDASRLQQAGFRLCLVSPELQGRDAGTEIPAMRALLEREAIAADAVCTKRPDLWT